MNNLGGAYLLAGRPGDSLPLLKPTLERRKVKLGPDHPDTLTTMNNLGAALLLTGRTAEALGLFEDVLRLRRTKLGPGHPDTLTSMNNLARARLDAGQTTEAILLFENTLVLRKQKLGAGHLDTLASMNHLAAAYLESGRWANAEDVLRECLARRQQTHPDGWFRFHTMSQLGVALAGRKAHGESEPYPIEGYEGLAAHADEIPPRQEKELAAAASRVVPFYKAWGKPEKALHWGQRLTQAGATDNTGL
jgi:tetratricopeptide (TPR) repeat protein